MKRAEITAWRCSGDYRPYLWRVECVEERVARDILSDEGLGLLILSSLRLDTLLNLSVVHKAREWKDFAYHRYPFIQTCSKVTSFPSAQFILQPMNSLGTISSSG